MTPEPCPGCGARFAPASGSVHPYMLASPACWRAFNDVLAREYQDPELFARCHRLTVDAYALQHPGLPDDRRAVRSVWLHFGGLHAVFACGATHDRATVDIQSLARLSFPPLPAITPRWDVTVADVDVNDHAGSVERWARAAFDGWLPLLGAGFAAVTATWRRTCD